MTGKQATPGGSPRRPEPKDGKAAPAEAPRQNGVRHLAALLPRLTKPALGKRGFAEGGIIGDWAAIVGGDLAEVSLPERLAFPQGARRDGTLHVRVSGALALELQHLEPVVIERINGHFGYRAVARLKIRQGPIPRGRKRRGPPAPIDPATALQVDAEVAEVADPGLRAALAGFGRALKRRKA